MIYIKIHMPNLKVDTNNLSFKAALRVEERVSLMAPTIYLLLPAEVKKYDFTVVYENAFLSFAMSKPELEPRWKSIYYPLSDEVWIGVIVHVILFPFLMWQVKTIII